MMSSTTFKIIVMADSGNGTKFASTMPKPEILLTDAWLGTRKKYTAAAMMATPPVRMAASFTRAAVSIVFFIVSYQLSLILLPVICSGVRARQSTRSLAAAISASI